MTGSKIKEAKRRFSGEIVYLHRDYENERVYVLGIVDKFKMKTIIANVDIPMKITEFNPNSLYIYIADYKNKAVTYLNNSTMNYRDFLAFLGSQIKIYH